jgi:dTDP-4-amino-4,6-dideoxygalactose transaminase
MEERDLKIPITKLTLDDKEAEAVKQVLASGWLIQGAKVKELEETLRKYVSSDYAVACSSCTTALHMGLIAIDVNRGDRVIVPAFTFVATPNAVEYVGARPVFADIDIDTFNIDCGDAAKRITALSTESGAKTTAIIPVHLFGMCADMRRVDELARSCGLVVLEDAACALGSTYRGRYAGALGAAGCYSFHPRKSLTTGEGGLLVTDDKLVYTAVHSLRDFGFESTNLERHKTATASMPEVRILGFNFRMTDIAAAIGIEQFKKFQYTINGRQQLAEVYDKELAGMPWLKLPTVAPGCNHTYQSYVTLIWDESLRKPTEEKIDRLEERRNRFVAHLTDSGIFTRQGTQAVHALDYYQRKYKIKGMDFPFAWMAARLSVTLPLFPQMTDEEQGYVITKIREFKP